ncbi:adenosylcobalamin-dependent ribonucleoside-diphosphate reductase [Trinickia diaoshuihuensis]|uniref:adenosylcobalamin-dependent ribonucleoside-diphosphate reductase n=1 Tax=Trinickia diaoshuihuensis TaxID=2292265 RepID=UPI000E239444|nr:adenosylcobalamin-dependent ribonucleoside-diphosphate reductase [Trinickia diaoshuihuensis]
MSRRDTAQSICASVLADRYLAPGESDRRDVFRRVALALAAVEPEPLRNRVAARFYRNMLRGAIGAGRIMANAGTTQPGTMVNCFVQPLCPPQRRVALADDIERALSDARATLSMGGGVGYDFSAIAPALGESGSSSGGVCPVVDRFDEACRRLTFAGARHGAQMAVLRCDHPDLVAFVRAKRGRTRWPTFNVSVAVTDAFMSAVADDAPWTLAHHAKPTRPRAASSRRADGAYVYTQIGARMLWRDIVECARESAEPGLLFIDTINAANVLAPIETIDATNPCGEQPLPAWGSCVLGPIDLSRLVHHPFGADGEPCFDYARLASLVRTQVRLLDNVITATRWPLAAQAREALSKRRIGVGVTGLADALAMMRLPYDAPPARALAARIAACIRDHAYAASSEIAAERGPYPLFDAAYHLAPGSFGSRLPEPVRVAIARHGLRNSHLLSFAPTGSVSLALADNCSNGIEPAYDWVYGRAVRLGGREARVYRVENHAHRLYHAIYGAQAPLPGYFRRAREIGALEHVSMLAALQPFVDAAISKTVTIDSGAYDAQVDTLLFAAWKARLKGITVFRPDPKLEAVLTPRCPTC